ncbi:hypothetical protein AWH62_14725 [Maricaulis sp. W15]|uniref:hypothetical protein n=1 Tax=Maricaulis sp. W15 TaxID=1772333 RepID=UPI00094897A0|nr:hypothetical protein [Maricaulis sp. W15]OLF80751.1 hypothetical protein AWH62_14725 [Maricaulis sp. W15]
MIRIDEAFQGRDNRFTPIRIALASLVIVEHVSACHDWHSDHGGDRYPLMALSGKVGLGTA